MKKVISFLIVCMIVVSVFPASCLADISSLKWGMNEDTVILLMGKADGRYTHNDGKYVELDYYDQSISAYKTTMGLGFYNNSLIARMYQFDDNDKEKFTYLSNALNKKYSQSADLLIDYFKILKDYLTDGSEISDEMIEAIKDNLQQLVELGTANAWKVDRETNVCLLYNDDGETRTTILFFVQPYDLIPEYNYNGL